MKFYSVKEIADLLKVSKPTVAKQIKDNLIECDEVLKGKQLYNVEHTREIIKLVNPFFDVDSVSELCDLPQKSANDRQEPQTNPQESAKAAENSAKNNQEAQNQEAELVSILKGELERKNKELDELRAELKAKDDRIERLYLRIEEFSDKAMYITAADKTAAIMDKSQQPKEEIKKHWFTFWKR